MSESSILTLLAGNTVVALALAMVAWAAGRTGRPALAHVAWLLVLVKLLTPPLWRVPVVTVDRVEAPMQAIRVAPAVVVGDWEPGASHLIEHEPPTTLDEPAAIPVVLPAPKAVSLNPRYLPFVVWLAGALCIAAVSVIRAVRFARTLRGAQAADDWLQIEIAALAERLGVRAPGALIVSGAVSPMLWFIGIGRPRLVLPNGLLQTMSIEQRAGVIAHELAHLRRRDHWVRLIELPATVLLWFHPLVWIARRGLREAEEQCCDAWAVSVLPAGGRTYADALVNAMELIAAAGRLPVGATGLGRLKTLRRRLTMIVTQSPPKSLSLAGRIAAVALLAAVVIAPVRGVAQSPQAAATGGGITVAPGQSIQAAIDKAPEGATITLAEGSYPDSFTITKPLTLVGAGWDKTTVGPEKAGQLTQQQKDEFFKRLEATSEPEQRARIAMELAAGTQPPTITVKGATGVTIRGLRVRGPRTGNPGSVNTSETLVLLDGATGATLSNAAVVGPFSNGVTLSNGSDVHIDKSLVAAMWGTGVQSSGSKLHLSDSDIRNCHHRCITLGDDRGSIIERNRISGSAWHGIRYDNCSPTIKDNLIFGSARFGIYASGRTAARVTGNVFWRNEMEGMGGWFNNADDVTGNTFVGNLRSGVAVLGDSTPKLTKNVIAQSPVGVSGGGISGRDNQPTGAPAPRLTANVFHGNDKDLEISGKTTPLPEGNVTADPMFVAPEKGDFKLAADSPARKLGAGAADPIPLTSPFPITAEETAMIPDGDTRDFSKWKKPDQAEAKPAAAKQGPTSKPGGDAAASTGTAATPAQLAREKENAKVRMQQDRRRFAKDDLADAERLYQVANKNWRSAAARESLKTMVTKYPDFNRTGCALLYLGQMAEGKDRESYLADAIKHGDCYYGDGVQVGAFARYLLGHTYLDQGKKAEAQTLFDQIRADYPNAITHSGDSLVAVMREEGQAMKAGTQPAE